ncbi:hypothetical protein [Pseudooceanicola sp. LIPI14-2-Ac024]|uniref:hypothetical protein n=1 Tax=Pseudooceanicola sp. LIPI14-2-Ac024 TaxID=3344875 RepID=UPI0035D03099
MPLAHPAILMATLTTLTLTPPAGRAQDAAVPDHADLHHYTLCEAIAAVRFLTQAEASHCAAAYTRVKLAFVPGVGIEDLPHLTPGERDLVNRDGYARFRAWRDSNVDLVDAVKANAATVLEAEPGP